MGRADWSKPAQVVNAGELEKVLDHYGVRFNYRTSQMTNCPLHEDRTPSLSINLDKQAWNCHSCGEGGGPVQMIAKKEGVTIERARSIGADRSLLSGGERKGGSAVRDRASGNRGRRTSSRSGADGGDGSYAPNWRRRRRDAGA